MALCMKLTSFIMFLMIMLQVSSSLSLCPGIKPFIHDLKAQCPTATMYSWPVEMDGESLDKVLKSSQMNEYVAILFYAIWCPFSRNMQPKFDALSSMYPQIKHVMVDQSSVPPIVFSRYGIHGVPSILLVNKTTRMRRNGSKDLQSLVQFYQKATGLKPIMDFTEDQTICTEDNSSVVEPYNNILLKNVITREPYLTFSVFFLFLKTLLYLYPNMVSSLIALWLAYIPHLNLAIFGESRNLFTRFLHLVDFKRAFNKVKLIKSRPFHNGARSARVWTSSLASFSLSKTSSSRASQGVKL